MPITAFALLILPAALVGALDNGLGIRPPMGWRSWNSFGRNVNMTLMEAVMDALVVEREGNLSLRDLGFKDVGLDDNWQACNQGVYNGFHDALGRPLVNERRFPDLRAMTAYAHTRGLTAGWYANNCICSENSYYSPVEISTHYHGDVQRLVDLHFDSVKLDHCGQFNNLDRWAELLNGTGRPILIENCHWVGLVPKYESNGELWCPFNYFRTSGDIKPNFDSMLTNLQTMTKWADVDRPISQPGCWAYPDMLEVGNLATLEEDRAHFAAWCVTSAPLILSLNLANKTRAERIWPIVSNPEMLAVNQQWAGHPGTRIFGKTIHLEDLAPAYVWGVPCDPSDPSQHGWQAQSVSGGRSLVMIAFGDSGLCLDATIFNPVGLMPCNESNPWQAFSFEPGGALKMHLADGSWGCLEVFGKTGPGLQVSKCWSSEAAHQAFIFNQGLWSDKGSPDSNQYPPRCMAKRGTYPYDLPAHYIGWQMWAKPQPGGSMALYIVNREEEQLFPAVEFAKLRKVFGSRFNHSAGDAVMVRDLYARKDVGVFADTFSPGYLAKRDSRFYLLSRPRQDQLPPPGPPSRTQPPPLFWLLGFGISGLAVAGVLAHGVPSPDAALKRNTLGKLRCDDDSSGWTESESDGDSDTSVEYVKPQVLEAAAGVLGDTREGKLVEAKEVDGMKQAQVASFMPEASVSATPRQEDLTPWALHVFLMTALWWAAAIYVKLMFKLTVHTALPPFILTSLVSTNTGLTSWALSFLQRCNAPPMPLPRWDELARVVLLGLMQGLELGFLNKSLEGLSVTESTMLQNINVLFMMITAWMCDLENLTVVRVCAGVLLAAGGTLQGLASSGHKHSREEVNAHVWGLVCMVISMLLTSAKWSLIQFMTQLSPRESFLGQLSKLQFAALVQPITGLVCLVLACIFERSALFNLEELVTPGLLLRVPAIALGITVISCCELKVVELTSAVACGILINLHHIPMILAGVITLHDTVDQQSSIGFVLCLLGGIIYAYSRYLDKKANEK